MIILIRTGEREATAERGACFLSTIGTTTPGGFTTGHPELDHDALREIISPCFTIVRDEGYSPLPIRSWKPVFSTPSKEICMSTS
jgi:hypothetical protein